ncbi:ThuA domain-containing protein [Haloferula chungangensis]|uniref:ThuA domain-containing protein n=1 Tax=Haloferula chungangensis TaxID=1048331 RepID=A0ABW2L9S4_9BACT
MKWVYVSAFVLLGSLQSSLLAKLPEIPMSEEWQEKVKAAAPENGQAKPEKERKVLIFSMNTGFKHWCIPHTTAVVEILGEKTGAYSSVESKDIKEFLPENISKYDAIVLNNNCPDGKDRDMFRDVLINKMKEFGPEYAKMPLKEREELATKLYQSLVSYVADGGGLVLLHGAITNFAYSDEFSAMVGGSFDFHPPQQEITLYPVSPGHPMLEPFGGKPYVYYDEPYIMKRAYSKLDFHPLLEMKLDELKPDKRLEELEELPRYMAWVKKFKKGRVFFCSPSHNAQAFETPELLGFILNGMQFATGDLACETAPPAELEKK